MTPVQICRGFTDEQWQTIRLRLDKGDESAWPCAVEVFERHIEERYLSCIEVLIGADSKLDVEVPKAPADCSTLPNDQGGRWLFRVSQFWRCAASLPETLQGFRRKAGETERAVRALHIPG
jgi:hypothetical protein